MTGPYIAINGGETARFDADYHSAHHTGGIDVPLVNGTPTSAFEEIARVAATICQVPIAAVTLSDPESRWRHSVVGTSLDEWIAAEAALGLLMPSRHGMEAIDVVSDREFAQNRLAVGGLDIRFYANVPIALPLGHCIGTLSVAALEPRQLTHAQRDALEGLARIVCTCLLDPAEGARAGTLTREGSDPDTSPEQETDLVVLASADGEIGYLSDACARYMEHPALKLVGANFLDTVADEDRAAVAGSMHDAMTRRSSATRVARMASTDKGERWVRWTYRPMTDVTGQIVAVYAVGRDVSERKRVEQALTESERRYREVYERTPAMLHSIDMQGRLVSVSDLWLRTLGYSRAEVLGRSSSDFLTPASREYAREVVLPEFFRVGYCRDVEYAMVRKDGEVIEVLLSAFLERQSDGTPRRSMAVIEDITDRKRMQASLAEQREFLQVTLHSIGDGVVTTEPNGRITYLNPVAERLTGWSIAEARGRDLADVFDARNESTREHAPNPVTQCLNENRVVGSADNIVLVSRSGAEHAIKDSAAPIVSLTGDVLGVVLVFHDVTEERRLAREMSYRATHDALTGLLNRAEFEMQLHRVLSHAREAGSRHAMLYIDLDQFKVVNDTFGHVAGDQLLQQVSEQLGHCIRATDTLARLGGDEFGVILEHCDTEPARRIASQICERLDAFRFTYYERRFHIGASIGLVPFDDRWPTTAAVLQAADNACYAAKDAGRNRVHSWFDSDQVVLARHGEMQWVTRLEQALDEDRFELYAQRIRALDREEQHVRCELLLRLREPNGNLVLPEVFLSAAERFHMASRIDRWVVKHVFAWMARHREQLNHVDSIAVNLSGQSIGDRAFHRYVSDLAEALQFDPHKLCFEVTETAAITNLSVATEFIESLRLRGIRFALDDFGSGASSFGYLKALPVDYLKIDGQFITGLEHDPIDQAVVRCICEVAKAVGMRTIAEFVETSAVAGLLRDMGADYIQGYFVHRPAPMEEVLIRGADPNPGDMAHALSSVRTGD